MKASIVISKTGCEIFTATQIRETKSARLIVSNSDLPFCARIEEYTHAC